MKQVYQLSHQYSLSSNLSSQQLSYPNNSIEFQLHHFLAQFFDYNYFMGWSTNEKALAKKNKEKQEKTQKEQKKVQEAENKKWKDEESDKKMAAQRQKEEKRQREIAKKRQLKELAEKQERQLQKINKKKQTFAEKKLTQAEIARNIEEREKKESKAENNHHKVYFEDNPNQPPDYEAVSSVEQALRVLDVEQEKHPQKRYKAAFEAYCSKREIQIRVEYPKLKRSQRMEMMHKQFQKHADNPFNKNVVAYNDKTRKQAKKAREEQKKQKQKQDEQKIEEKREEENE